MCILHLQDEIKIWYTNSYGQFCHSSCILLHYFHMNNRNHFNYIKLMICYVFVCIYTIVSYIDTFVDVTVGGDGGEAVEGWVHCE